MPVPINSHWKVNEVGYVATDSASRVVITSTERLVHVPTSLWGPEVGPGSLTGGDRRADTIRACRCGFYT
jgi:hypothetical protein